MSHTIGRERHPRSPARRLSAACSLLLAPLLLAGCGGSHADTNRIRLDSQPVTALAKAVRQHLHSRVARIEDMRGGYADRHSNVKQAVVLIDQRAGKQAAARDSRHHPMIVRYTSIDAAKHAVAGLPTDRFARVHATVLLLPAGFPQQAGTNYRKAFLLQALPAGIPDLR